MPDRIQLCRTAGWRKPEGARVVSRSTIWGNPWSVHPVEAFWWPNDPRGPRWISTHRLPGGPIRADQAVSRFRLWLAGFEVPLWALPEGLTPEGLALVRQALESRRCAILGALPSLRGCDLACWCAPGSACHADVLLALANTQPDLATCRKCGGPMREGIATGQTYSAGSLDFPSDPAPVTISPGGPGKIIPALKCAECGWSVTR